MSSLTHFGDLFDGCGIILSLLGGKATDTAQGAQKHKPPMPSPTALTEAFQSRFYYFVKNRCYATICIFDKVRKIRSRRKITARPPR